MSRKFDARIRRSFFFGFGRLRLEVGEQRYGDSRIDLGSFSYRPADYFLLDGTLVVAWSYDMHPTEGLASQICTGFGVEQIWFVTPGGLCKFEHVPSNAVAVA
jgi:hypothetical protein